MCGIAGVFGAVAVDAIEAAISAQGARGPDDRGVWAEPSIPVTLGHCRLSIIDVSSAGHQPMSYGQGRYWITFNGEIYNYRELRSQLEQQGCRFTTQCDTEVVLAAYACWGVESLKKLRGMFAFALVDLQPEPGAYGMLCVRDRLGIKPFVYTQERNRFWFASEVRGLCAAGAVKKWINPAAIVDYMAVGSVFQPKTIYQDTRMLPPGCWLGIRPDGSLHQERYWDVHEETRQARHEWRHWQEDQAVERLRELIGEATRYHQVSDVPVGAFLSGGLDSTTVVGTMAQHAAGAIHTFTVGFESAHRKMDERSYAGLIARHLHTQHTEIVVAEREVDEMFAAFVTALDQPSTDGFNTWLVSRLAAEQVKVCLSGVGGDELFAGYPHFAYLSKLGAKWSLPQVSWFKGLLRGSGLQVDYPRLMQVLHTAERFTYMRRLLSARQARRAWAPAYQAMTGRQVVGQFNQFMLSDADDVQQTTYMELNNYLLSTLLRDADNMSTAHSLELRPVLLDHRLVEFVYALPEALKLNEACDKPLIRKLAKVFRPPGSQDRKQGFELPYRQWMLGPLRQRFRHLIHGRWAHALLSPQYRVELDLRLRLNQPPQALWGLGILLQWMENGDIALP